MNTASAMVKMPELTQQGMLTVINVGMAEIATSKDGETILCSTGLGSCLGVAFYDPLARVSGLAHIVLPDSSRASKKAVGSKPGKFVDTAIPDLIKRMERLGARKANMVIKVAGGASMFKSVVSNGTNFNIGEKNFQSLLEVLAAHQLRLKAQDVGGTEGRTIKVHCKDGSVLVKTINSDPKLI